MKIQNVSCLPWISSTRAEDHFIAATTARKTRFVWRIHGCYQGGYDYSGGRWRGGLCTFNVVTQMFVRVAALALGENLQCASFWLLSCFLGSQSPPMPISTTNACRHARRRGGRHRSVFRNAPTPTSLPLAPVPRAWITSAARAVSAKAIHSGIARPSAPLPPATL